MINIKSAVRTPLREGELRKLQTFRMGYKHRPLPGVAALLLFSTFLHAAGRGGIGVPSR